MNTYAVILASGTGERSGLSLPKQFMKIAGKTVLEHTLEIFDKNQHIDRIIIVSHPSYSSLCQDIVIKNDYKKIFKILNGGETRQESSYIGLSSVEDEQAKILFHDAVRPFVSERIIDDCVRALDEHDAVDVAVPSADTIVKVSNVGMIDEIPDRSLLMRGQTPQGFKLDVIRKAHERARELGEGKATDDCGLVVRFSLAPVYVVTGSDYNIKITYPVDVAISDRLFQLKQENFSHLSLSKLDGKVVVVFGSSRGIGLSIANMAKKLGAKVYGFSRSNGVDVSCYDDVKKSLNEAFYKDKKIDIIINTAGVLRFGKIFSRDMTGIEEEININYLSNIIIAKASFEYLRDSKGSILFFASSSYTRGRPLYSVYSSTKAALVNLTQALSEEWQGDGIRVNIINPERTATPMRFENFGKEAEESLLSPDYVAEISLMTVLSEHTGQIIDVRRALTVSR